jgi:hypothetical protein
MNEIPEEELRVIVEALQKAFPYGHADFIPMTVQEMALHSAKNYDYAHGGDSLGNFYRVAAIFKNYPELDLSNPVVVALAYAMKQLDSALWQLCQGYEGKIEGLKGRLGDVSVYAKLAILISQDLAKKPSREDLEARLFNIKKQLDDMDAGGA